MSSSKKDSEKKEIAKELRDAIPRLPPELRKRILRYIEDYLQSKKEKIH